MRTYVSSWLEIEKSEQYKDLVLRFLRAFCSTVKVNQKNQTHYR